MIKLDINPTTAWAKRSLFSKRIHGFFSYLLSAAIALVYPIEVDKALYSVLKDQFIEKD